LKGLNNKLFDLKILLDSVIAHPLGVLWVAKEGAFRLEEWPVVADSL